MKNNIEKLWIGKVHIIYPIILYSQLAEMVPFSKLIQNLEITTANIP